MGKCDRWDTDDEFTIEDWKYEVSNDDTRLGYWDWVEIQRELSWEEDQC